MQQIAIVNECSTISDQAISIMVSAVQKQMDQDVGPVWNFQVKLNQIPRGSTPPNDQWWMVFLDDADMAGALGYHDLTPAGLPMGKVFVHTTLIYGQSISRVLSHETAEIMVDPYMNRLVQVGNKNYIVEVGDPLSLDNQGYSIDGILVSGIAYPAYFYGGNGPRDKNNLLPGSIPTPIHGTYLMWQENGNWQTHMFALNEDAEVNQLHDQLLEPKTGSRRERRIRGQDNWKISTIHA